MNESNSYIKLAFITGLQDVVAQEIKKYPDLILSKKGEDCFYINFVDFTLVKKLKSVSRAYLVVQNFLYNPLYISNHKSVLGNLIEMVIKNHETEFRTFRIVCAGSDSKEVIDVNEYIKKTYSLIEQEEADLKIHIIKLGDIWEIGIQITPRPLSVREYKIEHMSGAMDPTIAYAMNSLCALDTAHSYLNVFSGSGTLLTEAGLEYPNLVQMIGFDNNKKHLSLAIQNIKKAGLIEKVQLKEKDIFDQPDLGIFDVIVSDLPFGMVISKDADLEKLYQTFIDYCQVTLQPHGVLAVYTSEHEILEKIILDSAFKIKQKIELKIITSVDAYLYPKIFFCHFK